MSSSGKATPDMMSPGKMSSSGKTSPGKMSSGGMAQGEAAGVCSQADVSCHEKVGSGPRHIHLCDIIYGLALNLSGVLGFNNGNLSKPWDGNNLSRHCIHNFKKINICAIVLQSINTRLCRAPVVFGSDQEDDNDGKEGGH